ncbi:MAG: hypothetical protein A4E60_02284 [Syntrophorhabdus sp. PtaB.Bin047]|jgi:hypothetical protein|nr:MAG: hypothetical protein A4E60_02284 [Syntrophorhabdus sp. PtaB.Bin047]
MGSPKDRKGRLEKVLAAAYRSRGAPGPGEKWETQVMRSIRNLPDEMQGTSWTDLFGRLFWRVCPVACAIVILLAAAAFRYDVAPQQDLVQMFMDDTVETVLLDPYNG